MSKLLGGNFSLDISKAVEGKINPAKKKRIIEGYMTTPALDLENEVTDSKAYPEAAEELNQHVHDGSPIPIFIEHRRKEISLPVGRIISAEAKPNGIWFKGEIAEGKIADPVWELIEQGMLNGCSMGGDALETVPDFDPEKNKEFKRIKKMTIRELSLTGLPVNPQAVFSMAKSLNIEERKVRSKLEKLEKAIETEYDISTIEKAVNDGKIDEESMKRIKSALDGLEQLIGIKTDETPTKEEAPKETEVAEKPTEDKGKLDQILEKINMLVENKEKPAEKPEETIEEPKTTEAPKEEKEEGGEMNMAKMKDIDEKEEDKKEAETLKCKSCSMVFEKSEDEDYEVKFCPKCGKPFGDEEVEGEVDAEDSEDGEEIVDEESVDEEPMDEEEDIDDEELDLDEEGEDDEDEFEDDEEDDVEMVKFVDDEDEDDEFEEDEEDEDDESFEKNLEILQSKPSKDSGQSISTFKGDYIKPSTGKRTNPADTTEHEHPKPFKPLETGVSGEQFANYGKDRTEKSMSSSRIKRMVEKAVKDSVEETIKSSIEKAIDASNVERKVLGPIEKSQNATPDTISDDRVFARALSQGLSDPIPME